jgi:hypothetical protein
MKPFDLIKRLDKMPNIKRREIIIDWLEEREVEYWMQEYASGTNLVVDLGAGNNKIGISSHFDRVEESPGANDNSSAIAVCLDIISKYLEKQHKDFENYHQPGDTYDKIDERAIAMTSSVVWDTIMAVGTRSFVQKGL